MSKRKKQKSKPSGVRRDAQGRASRDETAAKARMRCRDG
jgi:hypothetical protein